jgi:hypothetical protein
MSVTKAAGGNRGRDMSENAHRLGSASLSLLEFPGLLEVVANHDPLSVELLRDDLDRGPEGIELGPDIEAGRVAVVGQLVDLPLLGLQARLDLANDHADVPGGHIDSSSVGAAGVGAPAAVTPIVEVPADASRVLLSAGHVSTDPMLGYVSHTHPGPNPVLRRLRGQLEQAQEGHSVTVMSRLEGAPEILRGGLVRRALSSAFEVIVARETNTVAVVGPTPFSAVMVGEVVEARPTEWALTDAGVEREDRTPIWDLTGGVWLNMCEDRHTFPSADGDIVRVCTRRAEHTGRHAAGNGVRIVAVWGGRP